jgi:non-ribosomal peptide synthetase-like protein
LTADPAVVRRSDTESAAPPTDAERTFATLLADVVGVEQVPIDGHFFDDLGADSMVMARFCARVRKHPDLPSVSMKDIYRHPTIRRLTEALTVVAAAPVTVAPGSVEVAPAPAEGTSPPVEQAFAALLAEAADVEQVPVDGHFFDDLGADSMVMARFCARVRKHPDLPSVSMKDIYRHPTIRSLAEALATTATVSPPVPESTPASLPTSGTTIATTTSATSTSLPAARLPVTTESFSPTTTVAAKRAGAVAYALCGAAQLAVFLAYSYLAVLVMARGYDWISATSDVVDIYLRSAVFGGSLFLGMSTLPIVAKWILVGRWSTRPIRVWSLGYLRFWLVKTLVRSNPLALFFVGSPLFVLYLRLLGARVGPGVSIFTRTVPICTDLLTIGAGTVIRKDSTILCYRAEDGWIQPGPVTLGRDVYIGEKTVLDIGTSMGDASQLGHSSALHSGQSVPAGERWHGSPAEPATVDYLRIPPAAVGALRRVVFSMTNLLQLFLVILPLGEGGLYLLMTKVPSLHALLDPNVTGLATLTFYRDAVVLSTALFGSFVVLGLVVAFGVPRVLDLLVRPDKVYPLYGFHYGIHRTIARLTNIKFFTHLFGDSSYIVHYLRGLGYDLSHVEQTGSNFGTEVTHESPYLSSVGSGTMVADGLSIMNAEFSSTSFQVSRVSIGAHNFLGNRIAYPVGGRTGDNCLLATKVMIPLDGEIREGVGLLGSPSFEIPRSVERDGRFDHLATGEEFRRRLSAKNRFNLRSMALYLVLRWFHIFLLTLLGLGTFDLLGSFADMLSGAFFALSVLVSVVYLVLVERAIGRFRSLTPKYCSVYDPYFWWHERLWKVTGMGYQRIFDGTPFKSLVWRALGVRVGRRLFDDGAAITERTLATIGDYCTLNPTSTLQCHSQEDGTFKSDHIRIGDGCSLGVGAFVHYGVTMGEGSVLAADSFLMKGEEVPPHSRWGGNPAGELREERPAPLAVDRSRRRPPRHARVELTDEELELQAEIWTRLDRLDVGLRSLESDGERAMNTLAQHEASLAQIMPTINQLMDDRRAMSELIRGGTTRDGR